MAEHRSEAARSRTAETRRETPQMTEGSEPRPAALYARVSSDRQDVDLSVAGQLRALRDYAEKNGYGVVREYVDEAESGRDSDRPEFNKMIDEAKSPKAAFQEILVWKFSRFSRKREHAVAYKAMLRRRGVRVVSITEHADDSPSGKLLEAIIESLDEFYSENLATEVRRGMREAASRGFWVGSRTPYGYKRVMVQDVTKKRPKLEPDKAAAPVVKRIFELADAGRGMLDITRVLNDEGIASATGKRWSKPAVHNILTNEVYTGTLVWGAKAKDEAAPVRVEKAFPAIVSKAQFRRVNSLMRSRAPRITHPRRVGSSFMLSGLIKCKTCDTLLSGQFARRGQYAYYVCKSLIRLGKGACKTPRLNARGFERLIVGRIRSSILTQGNNGDLANAVVQEVDRLAQEQRKLLETIESEIMDAHRRLERLFELLETSDDEIANAVLRINTHLERQGRLEDSEAEATAVLSQRRLVRDDAETIAANALDMTVFLKESELHERKDFIATFVREIVVTRGGAVIHYKIPMPEDSHSPGADSEEVLLSGLAASVADGAQ